MPILAAIKASSLGIDPHGVCSHAVIHSISNHGRTSAGASAHVSDCRICSWSSSKRQPLARVSAGYGAGFKRQSPRAVAPDVPAAPPASRCAYPTDRTRGTAGHRAGRCTGRAAMALPAPWPRPPPQTAPLKTRSPVPSAIWSRTSRAASSTILCGRSRSNQSESAPLSPIRYRSFAVTA